MIFLPDIINRIEQMEVKTMQGLTDLQNQVTVITNAIGQVKTLVASLNAQIATLQATIAQGGDNDADVEAQAQVLAQQATVLNNLVNPAPAPLTGGTTSQPVA